VVVLAWQAAAARGDIDGVLELTAADVLVGGSSPTGRGHALVRDWLARVGTDLEVIRAVTFVGHIVIVRLRSIWRSPAGEIADRHVLPVLFDVRDGLVVRVVRFCSLNDAVPGVAREVR
jgi:hypothetical protein